MKKQFFTLVVSIAGFCVSAQTSQTEIVVCSVADNIIENTSFLIVDTKTGKTYPSTAKLEYSPEIRVESPYNDWKYWNGVVNVAMVELGESLGDQKYLDYSKKNFDFIFDNIQYFEKPYREGVKEPSFFQYYRLEKLDDCGSMAASLADVYRIDPQSRYMDYLQRIGDYMQNKQEALPDGTFCRSVPRKQTIWADDLYMSVPFLARMGGITGDQRYFDLAVLQAENFAKYLYEPANGLYYHCWYTDVAMNGVAHWGRCNGWVMMATTQLLNYLPAGHPKREEVVRLLLRHIVGVSRFQDQTGLWHQILDKPDSYLESSCTAMFVYSIARAVNQGWIDESYLSIAKNGWKGLQAKIQPDGQVQDICVGTGISNDIRYYYDRPALLNDIHALGAVLLAGTEMIKIKE